jgi:hypothetical protein
MGYLVRLVPLYNILNLQIDVEAGLKDHKPALAALEQQSLSLPAGNPISWVE